MIKESENLNNLLQGKTDYLQKLVEQLELENKQIDELKRVFNHRNSFKPISIRK